MEAMVSDTLIIEVAKVTEHLQLKQRERERERERGQYECSSQVIYIHYIIVKLQFTCMKQWPMYRPLEERQDMDQRDIQE